MHAWNRRVYRDLGFIAVVLALVAGVLVLAQTLSADASGRSSTARPKTPTIALASTKAPSTPPARICGSAKLKGPSSPPKHAVRVSTKTNLHDLVNAKPGGTTFWLAKGKHTLGTGEFDSVQPKAGDTFIGGPGAVLDGQRLNRYAFVGQAKNVTIEYLTVQNFGKVGTNNNEGVVNHDSATGFTLRWSTVTHNAGAGVMVGSGNLLSHNCLTRNGQYAFNAYSPSGPFSVRMLSNEISYNNADNWEVRSPGCGCSGGGKFWDTHHARITGNYVHNNKGVGLWADTDNRDFLFQGNYISRNDNEGILYEISYNAAILDNTFVRNGIVKGPTNPGFPTGAIYLSESGSDHRVAGSYGKVFTISGNVFTDNWSGVIAWENADRFAGSPANSSSSYGTLVSKVATVKNCGNPSLIGKKPYINDCRWKTQYISVTHNRFTFTASHIGTKCTAGNGCGFNGLFSQYGSYPDWSPYKGTFVENHITFTQHNHWTRNTYTGPWHFMTLEAGHQVSWSTWRAGRYHQDAGSTKK